MANTFVKISTVTVGSGGAANIEFTSIPQTYTDLKLVVSGRGDFAGTREKYALKFNNSSTDYTFRRLAGYDSNSVLSDTDQAPQATGNTATASVFASAEYYIPNYTGANYKSWSADSVTENNSSSSWIVDLNAALWSNTAAITSMQIIIQGPANFVQYSTATLYGIKSS
jgi:hypothetical protein